jgi:site-specific DNA-methyltransferase (adenine-specific)
MACDIVRASSHPGDVVADFFAGSGCFLASAVMLGRRAIGCDVSAWWASVARARCAAAGRGVPYVPPPAPDRRTNPPKQRAGER